jgi:glucose-1-phosphate thymidylyltransferase
VNNAKVDKFQTTSNIDHVVILARGLGTRMRRASTTSLSDEQELLASKGIKALIPIEQPFLDYILDNLSKAGYQRIGLVIGPEHEELRRYYLESYLSNEITVDFIIQPEPLGTADAVKASEKWVATDSFMVINSDNYYPYEAYCALKTMNGSACVGFEREAMITGSNITTEKVRNYAVLRINADKRLREVIEKPDEGTLASLTKPHFISMNCWRFTPDIYEACRVIPLSPRGEYEITDAVNYAINVLGVEFHVVPVAKPVLDLSSRDDIPDVAKYLKIYHPIGTPCQ